MRGSTDIAVRRFDDDAMTDAAVRSVRLQGNAHDERGQ